MRRTLTAARVFDGDRMRPGAAVVVEDGRIAALLPEGAREAEDLGDATLAPGFVDWQANGGGGVLLNADPTREGAAAIARAHARFGTTALLPTLVTDAPAISDAAAEAVAAALAERTPGVVGIHFEGPHLSVARKGAHDAALIRPMEAADHARLARRDLGAVVATVAPESASPDDIARLTAAGATVSLGHSDCDCATAETAFAAGARAATHLFNAMSPFHHRAPGLAGAAMARNGVFCGIIADGIHVHPAALRIALAAIGPERAALVTDAMSTVGAAGDAFELNGRTVTRANGRLTLADGTLAGSDLDMASAVRFCVVELGVAPEHALRMASLTPARLLRLDRERGRIAPGFRADLVALDPDFRARRVWIGGEEIEADGGP